MPTIKGFWIVGITLRVMVHGFGPAHDSMTLMPHVPLHHAERDAYYQRVLDSGNHAPRDGARPTRRLWPIAA
jgi:hypothetical protein